ncbi:MAG: hypothetical protein QXL94_00165 [Candidatus Parvarchaeum sp.]
MEKEMKIQQCRVCGERFSLSLNRVGQDVNGIHIVDSLFDLYNHVKQMHGIFPKPKNFKGNYDYVTSRIVVPQYFDFEVE